MAVTSLRARLRFALLGLCLLIVPLVGLVIYALVQLQASTSAVDESLAFTLGLSRAWTLSDGVVPELTASESTWDRWTDTQSRARRIVVTLTSRHPAVADSVGPLQAAFEDVDRAALALREQVRRARMAAPDSEALRAILSGAAGSGDATATRERLVRTLAQRRDRFGDAASASWEVLADEQAYVDRLVADADRNLIALLLVTLVFVAALFVVLPTRLVRPIQRLTRAIEQAGTTGISDAFEAGDGELADLAGAVRRLTERFREFDARKRDRIVQDTTKIASLLDAAAGPAAVLSSRYVVEHANARFREVFGLTARDDERPLPDLLEQGGDALAGVLSRVATERERVPDVPIRIPRTGTETLEYSALVDPCRDRRGRVTHFTLVLRSRAGETV